MDVAMCISTECPRCGTRISSVSFSKGETVKIVRCHNRHSGDGCGKYYAVRVWIEPRWEVVAVEFTGGA